MHETPFYIPTTCCVYTWFPKPKTYPLISKFDTKFLLNNDNRALQKLKSFRVIYQYFIKIFTSIIFIWKSFVWKKLVCGPSHMATSSYVPCNEKNKIEERSYIPYRTQDVHSHILSFSLRTHIRTYVHTQYINQHNK